MRYSSSMNIVTKTDYHLVNTLERGWWQQKTSAVSNTTIQIVIKYCVMCLLSLVQQADNLWFFSDVIQMNLFLLRLSYFVYFMKAARMRSIVQSKCSFLVFKYCICEHWKVRKSNKFLGHTSSPFFSVVELTRLLHWTLQSCSSLIDQWHIVLHLVTSSLVT